ncbi:MAG: glycerol-3-phosphate acyltransferase [Chloroflexi bacterium]|nr:glycerol-3-phosphate acyltransferase [Chloroflexota bacterium]
MADLFPFIASLLIGYVVGAFPTGFFVGKLWNVDVRRHGSGRTGGTNVLRSVGWVGFFLTGFGDIAKGAVGVLLCQLLFPKLYDAHALAALGAMLGHNYSLWIAMLAKPGPSAPHDPSPGGRIRRLAQISRGGAGVGTTGGAFLALFPPIVLIVIPVFVVILLVVRYASVASLALFTLGPLLMIYFAANGFVPWSYAWVLGICGVVVYLVHIPNIQRLRAGTEKRFGERLRDPRARDAQSKG